MDAQIPDSGSFQDTIPRTVQEGAMDAWLVAGDHPRAALFRCLPRITAMAGSPR